MPYTATRIKDYRTRRLDDGRGVPYAESAAGEYCLDVGIAKEQRRGEGGGVSPPFYRSTRVQISSTARSMFNFDMFNTRS
jgi:hypothetical protein